MAITQDTVDFDRTLHDVKEALDTLTATLGEVSGCEYPRLIAREIQALIVACVAHEQAKAANGRAVEELVPSPSPDDGKNELEVLLAARDAEIARLRDLLHHGVTTIEAHTLLDPDGTAVMMQGDYQCISATAIEQWLDRAATALKPAKRSTA